MAEPEPKRKSETGSGFGLLIGSLNREYGPYAFGVVSLLIVWYAVVGPTLANNRIDTEALRAITESLSKTASSIEAGARLLDTTANKMERIADKLGSRP